MKELENISQKPTALFQQNRTSFDALMKRTLQDQEVQDFLKNQASELSQEEIERSYSKLFEFVQEKEKFDKNDTENQLAQGYRPRLILNHRYIDVSYEPTQETLAQERMRKIRSRISTMNIPRDARMATLGDLYDTQDRSQVFSKVAEFLNTYKEYKDAKSKRTDGLPNPNQAKVPFPKGLYLYGSFGVGKTFLLGAVANQLAQNGSSTTMIHFPSYAEEMKQAINTGNVQEKLNAIKNVEILMIDDIGAESLTTWVRDSILGIILQYRMQEQLPTFFTSNQDFAQLEKHLSENTKGDIEELKAKRIMERVKYLAQEVRMDGENRRNG